MNDILERYLAQSYSRNVLNQRVEVVMPVGTPEQIADIKAELARIDALRLGANLAQRDFASYQSKRALEELLQKLGEA